MMTISYATKHLTRLLLLLCCSGIHVAYADNPDSLVGALKENKFNDTTRVSMYGQIASAYENLSVDSMIAFATRGVTEAERIHYDNGKAYCQHQLGLAYLHVNDYTRSLYNFNSALRVYLKNNDIKRQANLYLAMADIYYRQNKFETALEYYGKGIKIYDEIHYSLGKAYALMSIGGLYNDLGSYKEALNNYLAALTAFEENKYDPGVIMTLTNIATLYATIDNFPKALEYVKRSEAFDDSKSGREQQLLNLTNIGTIYATMKDYGKSLRYFYKGYELAVAMKDELWRATTLVNLGDSYAGLDQYDTAIGKYEEAIQVTKTLKDGQLIVSANTGMGRVLVKMNKVKEAIPYILTSMRAARENNVKQYIFENAKDLSEAYEKISDFSEALTYHKIYSNYKDSVHNDKTNLHLQQIQFNYDLNKKEAQISLLTKDKQIQQTKSRLQRLIIWASLSVLILFSIATITLYRGNKRARRLRERAQKQKEEILAQSRKLEELNRFKDKTFSVLSHDLRGPMQTFASLISMVDRNELSPEEFSEMRPEMNRQLSALNILLDNLLNWARLYMQGTRAPKYVIANIHDVVMENIDVLQATADNKQVKIINSVTNAAKAICDESEINIVIRNLLMNAIKFTGTGGEVSISAGIQDRTLSIRVSDTGVGMTQAQLAKLFTTGAGNTTYGTEGEKGTGLGLLLCYEFVKANNGTISAESKVNEGTVITISLILA